MRFCKGTRVPTKTGVPPIISGSECTIPLRFSDFIRANISPFDSLRHSAGFSEEGERELIQLVDLDGGDYAEFEYCNGNSVIAERRDNCVVAEIATTTRDDYEVSDIELLER